MRILTALILVYSAQSFGCPMLAGSYSCPQRDGSTKTTTISQTEKDGVTIYDFKNFFLPADNQAHPIADSDNLKSTTLRGWCDEDVTLKVEIIGKVYSSGKYVADVNAIQKISHSAETLDENISGTLSNQSGSQPFSQEIKCTEMTP